MSMHMYMETQIDVGLCSLNVRGLRNALKRRCIFNWIRNSDYHLILLQETHSTPDINSSKKVWKSEFDQELPSSLNNNRRMLGIIRKIVKFSVK